MHARMLLYNTSLLHFSPATLPSAVMGSQCIRRIVTRDGEKWRTYVNREVYRGIPYIWYTGDSPVYLGISRIL
ncbi:hypothetical protein C8R45DRAFT_245772 [Mycena sanguinolenta]|nr:hypothetical protein C8R45DRAFT_245772 [Mycena sanguinolenta]